MTKKYISDSCISISVGKAHIAFSPVTGGGSIYYTDDTNLQEAIEKHYKFGTLFKLAPEEKKPAVSKPAPKKEVGPNKVAVACLEDAKEYLSEKFGISRTKLRSEKAIKEAAAQNDIEFVGI